MVLHRRLLSLAPGVAGPLLVCVGMGLLEFSATLVQAVLVAMALNQVIGGGLTGASGVVLALVGVILTRGLVVWSRETVVADAAGRIKIRLRDRLYDRLLLLGPGHVSGERSGRIQSTVVDGVEGLEAYYSRYLPQVVVCLTGPPLVVAWIARLDLQVAAVVLLALVAVPTVPRLWERALRNRGATHWQAFSDLNAEFLDDMQGMSTLKALGAVGVRRTLLMGRTAHLFASTMRQMAVSLIDSALTELAMTLGVAVAVVLGAFAVTDGDLATTDLIWLLLVTSVALKPLRDLSNAWHAGFLGISAADGIGELLDLRPPSPDRPGAVPADLPPGPPSLTWAEVVARYPRREEPALRGLTLRVEPGERLAVVGRSGAGKSTLVALLTRSLAPASGRVLLGSTDIADLPADQVRAQIAVVSQDTYLFRATVIDNLRLGAPDADEAQVRAAAVAASADTFVRDLPQGYRTVIGERGLTLSGGQRQRLSLARAILMDAPVLVLDEATSAVDAEVEVDLLRALEDFGRGRTTVVIAHRLNTVRRADRIAVLEEGRLVQLGPHEELLATPGPYARLFAAQLVTT